MRIDGHRAMELHQERVRLQQRAHVVEETKGERTDLVARLFRQHADRPDAKFYEHDLTDNVAYTCAHTFLLVSPVSTGLRFGFVPGWTQDLLNRGFELKKVRGVAFKIGLGVAWNREDSTASGDDIIDIDVPPLLGSGFNQSPC
ncbi:hypothetical protein PMI11_01817 [Rhizobium sp. CF142]|nr:hypothetical protein PMI11_01817 [Rhizobium sp. CF142]